MTVRRPGQPRWTLSVQVTALALASAVVLGAIATGITITAVRNRDQTDAVFTTWSPLRTSLDRLLIALVNEETAIRGYAVNAAEPDLRPYTQGQAQEATALADIDRLTATEPDLLAQAHAIAGQAVRWRATVAQPVIERIRAGDRTGAQVLLDDAARDRFDQIRTDIAVLDQALAVRRDAAVAEVRATNSRIIGLLTVAALVVLLAGVLLAVSLRHLVTLPVRRLAGDVGRVAGGDYDHEVAVGGPRELAELGAGVEGMRRKIVADLVEVQRARTLVEQRNAQLAAQTEELTRSNRDLEQFAYVASHDLQEPLRKVASFCQLLQRRYADKLDERADQYIAFAVDGAQRMQRLINDLLEFSRIGRLTSDFTNVDLGRVAAEVVSQRQESLSNVDAEVTWDPLPVVRGEEPLLTALLGNLVGNSVKFHRPGHPPRVRLSARRTGDAWEITCADNGIGIEPEFVDKVFVIFQRLHARDSYPGTGIGLAVAKKIVEYHGGHIWIDPAPGPGATVRFTLPDPAAEPNGAVPAGAQAPASTSAS